MSKFTETPYDELMKDFEEILDKKTPEQLIEELERDYKPVEDHMEKVMRIINSRLNQYKLDYAITNEDLWAIKELKDRYEKLEKGEEFTLKQMMTFRDVLNSELGKLRDVINEEYIPKMLITEMLKLNNKMIEDGKVYGYRKIFYDGSIFTLEQLLKKDDYYESNRDNKSDIQQSEEDNKV